MAERPFFFVTDKRTVGQGTAEFEWFSGFSASQKQKSIAVMHESIRERGYNPLEISTKSPVPLGRKLSAFNLCLNGHPLECVFQSSKVFEHGGPYTDILDKTPKEAKRDERLRSSGKLVAFHCDGRDFPIVPQTFFYDLIYALAVDESLTPEEKEELKQYNAFTDIEFNPKRSINTQAKSCAIVRSKL